MHIKSGNIEGFKSYSQFSSLKEFNHHIEMWLAEYKRDLSKSELVAMKRLTRFSAKIPGVCNAKIGTILKSIHEEFRGNGISRSTFKRMILKAKEIGMITVYETERKNGSQTSNLYIFNRFPSNEPPKEVKMDHQNKTINLSKTNKKDINKRCEKSLDETYTNDRVPSPFVQLVKYFFTESKTIEEFWKMTRIAAYRNNRENDEDKVLELSIHAFKQLIGKLKSTKKVQKPLAYYYGI
jgi:N-acetylglutamate synthase-like GNAT family acetyltransferase